MARTTRKQVEAQFARFVSAIGGRVATSYNDVGAYALDYAGEYGGYIIARIVGETGAQSRPFGDNRRKASDMWDTLHFALDAEQQRRTISVEAEEAFEGASHD